MRPSAKHILTKAFGTQRQIREIEDGGKPEVADIAKVQAIIDDKDLPETAEDGKAYVVQWADGRGVFAIKSKKGLQRWLKKTGSWACIVSIKYGEPKHKDKKLKVVAEGMIIESIQLKDFGEYSKLVSKAYQDAPEMDAKAVPSWKALIAHIETLYKRLTGVVKVEFVDGDPYPNAEEMTRQVKKTKVLKIWKGGTGHPIWTVDQNLKFRAVHDYYSHIVSRQPFGTKGEIRAYNTHIKMAPPAAVPALFTEIVGQACTSVVTGEFPVQKIAFLPGFDYYHLGRVEGHEIVNKELKQKAPAAQVPAPQTKPAPTPVPAVPLKERIEVLKEAVFTVGDLDLDKTYNTFKNSYEKQTGKAWEKDKFQQRIADWTLYGEPDGFVATRQQASGPIKLVGAAGNPAGVKKGFQELLAQPKPIWGAMDLRLATIASRMGMKMPPAWIMKKVLEAIKDRFAQASGVSPEALTINSDGSVTIDYPDVGRATKFLVGNKAYFQWLLKSQGSAIPAMLRTAITYFLTTGKPPPMPKEEDEDKPFSIGDDHAGTQKAV